MNVPPPQALRDRQLDVLISLYDGLAKRQDMRVQRTDTASASLMTASVALGAAVVATADRLPNLNMSERIAIYVAMFSLVGALLFGGAPRAGRLIRLSPRHKELALWLNQRSRLLNDLGAMVDGPDELREAPTAAKENVARYWRATAEAGKARAEWNFHLLAVGGAFLALALVALIVLAFLLLAGM